jgi:hypothetical protein
MSTKRDRLEADRLEADRLKALVKNRDVLMAFHNSLQDEDRRDPSDEKKKRARELLEAIAKNNQEIAELQRKTGGEPKRPKPPGAKRRKLPSRSAAAFEHLGDWRFGKMVRRSAAFTRCLRRTMRRWPGSGPST